MTTPTERQITRRGLLAASAAVPLCGILTRPASAAEFNYKLATGQDPTHPVNVRAQEAIDRIREATGGRLEIKLFPANRFCQVSRHYPWPTRARVGIGPASHRGADEDAVLGMRIGSRDRATRAHCPGLSPVPLPSLRQAVQRVQRRCAEPGPIPVRCHRARGALAPALQAELTRSARDVRRARHRVQL